MYTRMKLFVAFACIRRLASHRGFTLIETLIAVLILTTAIAGPLTIAAKSFMAAVVVKDQIIASYLAQDAVEYIRHARDTNRLAGSSWLNNLDACLVSGRSCRFDSTQSYQTTPPADCANPCPTFLRYNNDQFTYTGGVATIFKRTVVITQLTTDEAAIEVKVEWSDQAGITRSVVVRENIFNWQ